MEHCLKFCLAGQSRFLEGKPNSRNLFATNNIWMSVSPSSRNSRTAHWLAHPCLRSASPRRLTHPWKNCSARARRRTLTLRTEARRRRRRRVVRRSVARMARFQSGRRKGGRKEGENRPENNGRYTIWRSRSVAPSVVLCRYLLRSQPIDWRKLSGKWERVE